MLRLFVAIPLPAALRDRLSGLRTELGGARWTHPENLHVTLRFIGDTPGHDVPSIASTLGAIDFSAHAVTLSGLGMFPGARDPRVLFVRVVPPERLLALRSDIERSLVVTGLNPDPKPFRPHVTVARLRGADPREVRQLARSTELEASFLMSEFILYASRLLAERAVHEPVARFRAAEGRRAEAPQ